MVLQETCTQLCRRRHEQRYKWDARAGASLEEKKNIEESQNNYTDQSRSKISPPTPDSRDVEEEMWLQVDCSWWGNTQASRRVESTVRWSLTAALPITLPKKWGIMCVRATGEQEVEGKDVLPRCLCICFFVIFQYQNQ